MVLITIIVITSAILIFSLSNISSAENVDSPPMLPEIRGLKGLKLMVQDLFNLNEDPESASTIHSWYRNYGCHCFSDKSKPNGRGEPVDQLDLACRAYTRCMKCVEIEFSNHLDIDKCPYAWKGYKYRLHLGENDADEKNIECTSNISSCARAQCECDAMLAMSVRELYLIDQENTASDPNIFKYNATKYSFDPEFTKQQNKLGLDVFRYELNCLITGKTNIPTACCGSSFPYKRPYDSTNKGCCAENSTKPVVFDTEKYFCCDNGQVALGC